MLILLPPSEGKTAPATGAPLDLDSLMLPELSGERHTLLGTLESVSGTPNALSVLGVGESLAAEVEANLRLTTNPAAPAHRIYTGVLYDALDYASLAEASQRRGRNSVVIFSGLFGVTGLADRLPAYRLSMSVKLPGIGPLAAWWRPRLTPGMNLLASHSGVVVDCRSGGYAAQWKSPAPKTLAVDVFQLRDGELKVVSHWAKHTRGRVARALLQADARRVRTPQAVVEYLAWAGDAENPEATDRWSVTHVPSQGSKPGVLRVILPGG
ncbi:MAG: YaaA family protein [Micrococcaceae bacterium]